METKKASTGSYVVPVAVACFIALNLVTFLAAYPQTSVINGGCCNSKPLQKDFSAFYTGAWRLFHDPTHIYTQGNVDDGQVQTSPPPEQYKYLPSFLFMVAPFLVLGYQQALTAFDVFQFLLLPLMAFLLYELVKREGRAVTVACLLLVIFLPLPWANWGLSIGYYWQWVEGQSKVLETFLLLLSFYLGTKRRPRLSGIAFALTAFDPRFMLLSIPLFVVYNKLDLRRASLTALAAFAVSNAALLYPGIGSGFINMVLNSGLSTPLIWYAMIPLSVIVALTVIKGFEIGRTFARLLGIRREGAPSRLSG